MGAISPRARPAPTPSAASSSGRSSSLWGSWPATVGTLITACCWSSLDGSSGGSPRPSRDPSIRIPGHGSNSPNHLAAIKRLAETGARPGWPHWAASSGCSMPEPLNPPRQWPDG